MGTLHTSGLVLRRADYGDYDRMVTLFTPNYGRIDAVARGCRRPKSPLVNAVEPFVSGDFQLFTRNERYSIDQCQIHESFYSLRMDYDRLTHGVYWLKLLEAVIMPEEAAPQLFLTTLHALAHLNYSDYPPTLLTAVFELHLMTQLGLAPRMDSCILCGRPVNTSARFDAGLGGCICLGCPSAAPPITNGARRILMKAPRTSYQKVALLVDRPEWQEAARHIRACVNERLHTGNFAPPLHAQSNPG